MLLKGKVTSELTELEGIYIRNLQTDDATLTDNRGYFSIMAKDGDSLMFSSVQFKGRRLELTKDDFNGQLFFVRLEGMINTIDEVKIMQYNSINAVSLGIIPKGQKTYTPAERKLETATGGGLLAMDPVLNWISGRTDMLKKELQVEKKEFLLEKISRMFDNEYFTETLNIPVLYVRGFCYYAIEDKNFVAALNNKNKIMATFLLGELSAKYLKLIPEEK